MASSCQSGVHGDGNSEEEFLRTYGTVYENSVWIARQAWRSGVECGSPDAVVAALRAVVGTASENAQLELLRAHPDLAGRLALRDALTSESALEQSGAGLDQCSPDELAAFQNLNERYTRKFGFPFILAVRGRTRAQILSKFRQRVENDTHTEFREALEQVHRIARFRIEEVSGAPG